MISFPSSNLNHLERFFVVFSMRGSGVLETFSLVAFEMVIIRTAGAFKGGTFWDNFIVYISSRITD